ncbi:type IV pilin accessory protein [Alkanindiges hydrocarboniclasticus]|uniref:Type IV pilin accessory protein n=1 Tax=Alkanindiges hydrocarboniclasticus TaxID=1907941 RepID=A0A1S8CTJ2_9GAMM|nr:TfpX/TfpZ family type IV pilin accessory protein [Alkanindiges hydrocarboniclasticus]ONG38724.1 type IV pilin accessory protein [Alkanindiges hydrocarboniclasticus]
MSKRIKFFLTHLAISILIAIFVSGVIFFLWYPMPLAKSVGVTHIVMIMLTVDVVIGPFFTLLVYKETKKTLKLDLILVILFQVLAFLCGFYTIIHGRPAWIVYNVNGFELIRVNDINQKSLKNAEEFYHKPSWLTPKYVAVKSAKSIKQHNEDVFMETFRGISLAQCPDRYMLLEQAKQQLQQHAQRLKLLNQFNDKASVQAVLKRYPEASAWIPLKATVIDMTVLIDNHGEVIKIVDLRPWK